jgi:hypothetical protein
MVNYNTPEQIERLTNYRNGQVSIIIADAPLFHYESLAPTTTTTATGAVPCFSAELHNGKDGKRVPSIRSKPLDPLFYRFRL